MPEDAPTVASDTMIVVPKAEGEQNAAAAATTVAPLSDEEQRLRDKLQSGAEVKRLREKLKAKKQQESSTGAVAVAEEEESPAAAASRNNNNSNNKHTRDESSSSVSPENDNRRSEHKKKKSRHPRSRGRSGRHHRQRQDRHHRAHPHEPPPPMSFHHPPPQGPPRRGGPMREPYPGGGGGGGGRGGPPDYWRGGPPPPSRDDSLDPFGRRARAGGGGGPPPPPPMRSRSRSRDDNRNHRRPKRQKQQQHPQQRHGRSRSPRNMDVEDQPSDSSRSRSTSSSSSASSSSSSSTSSSSYSKSRSRSRSYSSGTSHSRSRSSSSSRSSSVSSSRGPNNTNNGSRTNEDDDSVQDNTFSKDQRTVFVNQLTQKTTKRDLEKWFKSQGLKTNEIILLRDRITHKHKGLAYVELKHMADVAKACSLSGQKPDFQRFPILIKASEAEKNYVAAAPKPTTEVDSTTLAATTATTTAVAPPPKYLPPLRDPVTGRIIQAQKVYVGNLETSMVTIQHLQALFAPFGTLQQVHMPAGKGYAFLQYHDPKEASLAIQSMAGQLLAGKPIKTGWATAVVGPADRDIVTATEFPPDAAVRTSNAYQVLAHLQQQQQQQHPSAGSMATAVMGIPTGAAVSRVPTVAEARANLAAAAQAHQQPAMPSVLQMMGLQQQQQPVALPPAQPQPDPTQIGNAEHPTRHIHVHNMFDKDEETEPDWPRDIQEEFQEECSKYGTIERVTVVSREPGGQIYATFAEPSQALQCAKVLAGRWFDRRQLRVEFVAEDDPIFARVQQEYP